ncbi:MAG: winged helix-turn-helix domain-containing protein [Anaerolineae bacterium]|nr:winged helix-turn-helix domain-containing protein [Anaerolineae bacterium]
MIQLTSTEHRLLRYLMENPNQALSTGHLLQAVWAYPPRDRRPRPGARSHPQLARQDRKTQQRQKRPLHPHDSWGWLHDLG